MKIIEDYESLIRNESYKIDQPNMFLDLLYDNRPDFSFFSAVPATGFEKAASLPSKIRVFAFDRKLK